MEERKNAEQHFTCYLLGYSNTNRSCKARTTFCFLSAPATCFSPPGMLLGSLNRREVTFLLFAILYFVPPPSFFFLPWFRTMQAGRSVFEHHEYMAFRYARLSIPSMVQQSCSVVAEGARATLDCGSSRIERVLFASYGTPSGSCPDLSVNASCHAQSSLAVVAKNCLNKTQCTVDASNEAFGGDPCHLTAKRLAVAVQCAVPVRQAPPAFNISAWRVHYPWDTASEGTFSSDNAMLNAVWALCRNSIQKTSMDTLVESEENKNRKKKE